MSSTLPTPTANGDGATPAPRPAARPRKKSRRNFIIFFAALLTLTVVAITLQLWFKFRQQLKPDQLAAARQRWAEKGPRDYELEYIENRAGSPSVRWISKVQAGKTIDVTKDGVQQPDDQLAGHDMEALYAVAEEGLAADAGPGAPWALTTAELDPHDGRIRYYLRSVFRPRSRLQIIARVTPPAEAEGGR